MQSFSWNSTTDEVLDGMDLTGKRILITGVSAGIGVETARVLVAHGASVVGAVRDIEKARRAMSDVLPAAVIESNFELAELDLGSLASVRACTQVLVESGRRYDAIICNAGIMACRATKTQDGFESQFGTNHLGHFLFVNRIADLIQPGGRVVCLTSAGHRFANVDLDDPNFERIPYDAWRAYGRSKTANVLFAVESTAGTGSGRCARLRFIPARYTQNCAAT